MFHGHKKVENGIIEFSVSNISAQMYCPNTLTFHCWILRTEGKCQRDTKYIIYYKYKAKFLILAQDICFGERPRSFNSSYNCSVVVTVVIYSGQILYLPSLKQKNLNREVGSQLGLHERRPGTGKSGVDLKSLSLSQTFLFENLA